jgi:hypothetical protein
VELRRSAFAHRAKQDSPLLAIVLLPIDPTRFSTVAHCMGPDSAQLPIVRNKITVVQNGEKDSAYIDSPFRNEFQPLKSELFPVHNQNTIFMQSQCFCSQFCSEFILNLIKIPHFDF